jgi:AraC-like DNA-binding protein
VQQCAQNQVHAGEALLQRCFSVTVGCLMLEYIKQHKALEAARRIHISAILAGIKIQELIGPAMPW